MSMISIQQVQDLIDEKTGFGQDEFSKPALALLDGDMCHLVSHKDVFLLVSDYVKTAHQAEHGYPPTTKAEIQSIMRTDGTALSDSKRYHLIDIITMLDDPQVVHDLRGLLPKHTTKLLGHTMATAAARFYTAADPNLTIQGLIEKKTEAELVFTIRYESESALLSKLTVITNELQKRQPNQN